MADYSAPRKSKLTKKTTLDKGSKLTDRSQINITINEATEEKISNEPYQCTGRFIDDFQNLCKQNQISFIPPIINRGKRPTTPTLTDTKIEKTKPKRGTVVSVSDYQSSSQSDQLLTAPLSTSQKQQSISTLNEHDENKEIDIEQLPKTFVLIKDRFEYFRPKIQIEVDNFEKGETVSELYIKGWKIETSIMNILQHSLPFSEKLSTINLWNCGLNEDTLDILATFLPKCPNLKNVALDGNPISEQDFYKLIKQESLIQFLSLKNCQIDDNGAEKIGKELGTIRYQNTKLLGLNLSGNFITDNGAIEIARGLRTNRTLLILNLSGNHIGDLGACKLAETLSKFKMSHEEIVRRRTIKRERILKELSPASRRTKSEFIERSLSTNQKSLKDTKNKTKADNPSNAGRDRSKSKDLPGRESAADKSNIIKGKSKETKESIITASNSQKKEKSKEIPSNAAVNTDKNLAKSLKTKGSKNKTKDSDNENEGSIRSQSKLSTGQTILANENDPLMDDAKAENGELMLIGNRTLITLNLSRNKITLIGLKEFLLCIEYQMSLFNKSLNTTGLLKLNLTRNDFPISHEYYLKLNDLMRIRDPIANKAADSLIDKDTSSIISKEGKDTSRSRSSRLK